MKKEEGNTTVNQTILPPEQGFSPRRTITFSVLETVLGSIAIMALGAGFALISDHFTITTLNTRVSAIESSYVTTDRLELTISPIKSDISGINQSIGIISMDIKTLLKER